jgi:hypothetical protein
MAIPADPIITNYGQVMGTAAPLGLKSRLRELSRETTSIWPRTAWPTFSRFSGVGPPIRMSMFGTFTADLRTGHEQRNLASGNAWPWQSLALSDSRDPTQ